VRTFLRKDRAANPKRYKEYFLKRNIPNTLKANREWYARNVDEQRIRASKWYKNNTARSLALSARRRAAEINATPSWLNQIQLNQIEEMYDVAAACDTQIGVKHHVDHIFPLQGKNFCGLHVPWNLQVIPATENIAKHNKPPQEYAHLF